MPEPSPASADAGHSTRTDSATEHSTGATLSGPTGRIGPDSLPNPFGRYQLERLLGRGGMGEVYLARDTLLDRPVALKVPRFGSDSGPDLLERFLREARAAAALRHPHICPVF